MEARDQAPNYDKPPIEKRYYFSAIFIRTSRQLNPMDDLKINH
jgi:hypothetical protein